MDRWKPGEGRLAAAGVMRTGLALLLLAGTACDRSKEIGRAHV